MAFDAENLRFTTPSILPTDPIFIRHILCALSTGH